jgi:hypothetical protein
VNEVAETGAIPDRPTKKPKIPASFKFETFDKPLFKRGWAMMHVGFSNGVSAEAP